MGWFALTPVVQWTLAGIFGLLVMASLFVALLRRLNPDRNFSELSQRVNTWWVMVIIFTVAMVVSRTVSLIFFAFVSFLALKEYLSLIPTRRADRRPLFWAYLAIPIQYYWVYAEWYGMFIVFIPVFCFLLLPVRMLLIGETEGYLRATGTLQWGLMTTVFSLSHAAFLLILRQKDHPEIAAGPGLMLYLVVLTQLNDVAQYIWGKTLGRAKIVPSVSPKKTWIGFLGGVATTTLLATLLGPFLTPMDHLQSLVAGLIIGVGGFFGDINLSALKRDLGIKDAGSLLPGHGGILDRVNSLTYTAPLFFHYIYYLFSWHTFGASWGARP
jgi:phosphatidate cytidylyltransferase